MKKRWAAVLLLLALLAGCGSPAAQNKTVLGVWREAGPGSTAAEKHSLFCALPILRASKAQPTMPHRP